MTSIEAIRLVNDAELQAAFDQSEPTVRAFVHRNWDGKRDYEATNVIACVAASAPSEIWVPCESSILSGLTCLGLYYAEDGQSYRKFGHL
jgi:hypothetical protein